MRFFSGFLALVLFSPGLFAKTGYVDMKEALQSTRRGRKVQKQLRRDLDKVKKEIAALEADLTKDRTKLEQDIPLLSEQKRARRVQQFQQKVLQSQKEVEAKKSALQQKEDKLMSPVVQKLQKVIGRIAGEEGYTAVLNKDSNVLWVSPERDLTKKAAALFDKKHK